MYQGPIKIAIGSRNKDPKLTFEEVCAPYCFGTMAAYEGGYRLNISKCYRWPGHYKYYKN